MCGVHNITEILNILSSIDSNYLLKFHLACFSCFRTAQTTANNRHVFRVDKLPDRPPRFHIPRHFLPKVQSIFPENFISFFLAEIQSLVTKTVLKGGSTSNNMPSGRTGKALFYWKVWRTPVFECSGYVEGKKVRKKKIKKITRIFLYLFFRNACVTSSAIWTFHHVLNIFIFIFFFRPKNWEIWQDTRWKSQPY